MNLYDILPVNKHASTSSRRKRSSLYSDNSESYSERKSFDSESNAHVVIPRDPPTFNITRVVERVRREYHGSLLSHSTLLF
jgi:hypothetical protein